jgi:hypothetical protein
MNSLKNRGIILAQSCLAAMTSRTDVIRIRAILAGDASIKVPFKDNVNFVAQERAAGLAWTASYRAELRWDNAS